MKKMVTMQTFGSREEWLAARSGRIGGSDASAIINRNRWKSNVRLWEEKTGLRQPEDISEKPHVKYGSHAEEHLRELFKLDFPEYKVLYQENNMWLNDKFPFAHASLDGWLVDQNGRQGILEIKTKEIMNSLQEEEWKNRMPDNYFAQIVHYLMITEFDFVVLKAQLRFSYSDENKLLTKHYHIERSEVEADIEFLQNSEKTFWKQVQEQKCPDLKLPEI